MGRSNDNKEFWQRTAKLYSPFMKRSGKLYDEISSRIRQGLTPEMTVLELACGSGQLSFRLAECVRLWEATDFSENMIQQAEKRPHASCLRFSVQDATALPYAPGSFDAAVIANALHIMPRPELALAEISRVLKPGGTLFAPTFVHGKGASLPARLLSLAGFKVYAKWSPAAFADFVANHGFAVSRTELLGGSLAPLCYLESKNAAKIR